MTTLPSLTALDQAHTLLADRHTSGGPYLLGCVEEDATIAQAIRDAATTIRRLQAQNTRLTDRLRRKRLLGETLNMLSGEDQLRG